MCGPSVVFDWIVLDIAYVMVLVGGSMVLRARIAPVGAWIAFGLLSVLLGGSLFSMTYHTQAAASALAAQADTAAMLAAC
ncbi:MAG TPA: hypothetical protein VM370_11060 [Candidatus Thermoplasmatota archaeon]|nr:hypothetical protein [Candidatus Thermoplasmatota archaeon]